MHLHEYINIWCCITQEKYIMGRPTVEIESILGFNMGLLSKGFVVAALEQLPNIDGFELLGYTQVAEHRRNADATKGLDVNKLKEMVRKETFAVTGINRLVKVLPNIPHQLQMSNDEQYPPGVGVPQWKLIKMMTAKIIAVIPEGKMYL